MTLPLARVHRGARRTRAARPLLLAAIFPAAAGVCVDGGIDVVGEASR